MKIRPATALDIPELLELLKQLFHIEEDFEFSQDRQQKGLEMLIETDKGVIMVAEDEQAVIGMASGQLVISTAEGGYSLLIEDVVIKKYYQGNGLGSKLLSAVGSWGKENGANRMQLLADKNNSPAIDFYRKNSWMETALIGFRKYQ